MMPNVDTGSEIVSTRSGPGSALANAESAFRAREAQVLAAQTFFRLFRVAKFCTLNRALGFRDKAMCRAPDRGLEHSANPTIAGSAAMNARTATVAIIVAGLMMCVAAAASAKQPQRVTGTLLSVERLPNIIGANCGWHFDLTVAVAGKAPQVVLHVYDMGMRQDDLVALKGRNVEIDVVGRGIVRSIRAAEGTAGSAAALSDWSTIKYC